MADNPYGINFGNVVTDPAAQSRIIDLARGVVDQNQTGGHVTYSPDQYNAQVREHAYGYFPTYSGGAGSPAGAPVPSLASGGAVGAAAGAPKPTPYGDFTAPTAATLPMDPGYQFRLSQGLQALQNSAAARGTLLTGATAKGVNDYAGDSASQEYQNAYGRALQAYDTNRDTNQQNFGQQMSSFQGGLAATGQAQNFGLASNAQAFNQGQTAYENKVAADQTAYNRSRTAYLDSNGQAAYPSGYGVPSTPAAPAPAYVPPPSYSLASSSAPQSAYDAGAGRVNNGRTFASWGYL